MVHLRSLAIGAAVLAATLLAPPIAMATTAAPRHAAVIQPAHVVRGPIVPDKVHN